MASPGPATVATKASLVSLVTDHVRDMIFEQRVHPGQRLVTEAIAEELGVSRVPVREALRQLDGSGLVEIRDRRGAVVVTFDQTSGEELIELLRVRRELEPWAAAEAARHRQSEHLARLDAALDAGTAAAGRGNAAAAGRAHHLVLQSVALAARNQVLLDTLTPLQNRTAIAFSLVAHETLPDGWPAHGRVRDAIERRDARAARRETRAHLDDVIRAIERCPSVWRATVRL